jgi:hypothetical protein
LGDSITTVFRELFAIRDERKVQADIQAMNDAPPRNAGKSCPPIRYFGNIFCNR